MSETVKYRCLWYIYRGHWLNRGILAATWLPNIGTEPVSHCEVWERYYPGAFSYLFETDTGYETAYYGQCWTSTTRDDDDGTVVRPAAQVLTNPERWYYTEHEVDKFLFHYAKTFADARVHANKGYSYRDLSRFIMPLWLLKVTRLADNGREICSEHVAQWLVDMGVLDKNTIPSPRRLCRHTVLATGSPLKRLSDDKMIRTGKWEKW